MSRPTHILRYGTSQARVCDFRAKALLHCWLKALTLGLGFFCLVEDKKASNQRAYLINGRKILTAKTTIGKTPVTNADKGRLIAPCFSALAVYMPQSLTSLRLYFLAKVQPSIDGLVSSSCPIAQSLYRHKTPQQPRTNFFLSE